MKILNRLIQSYLAYKVKNEGAIKVSFTGGLGAQILSAGIVFHFQSLKRVVYADLSYFNQPYRGATPGRPGSISHWNWELDCYGIERGTFDIVPRTQQRLPTLQDGALKLSLAVRALSDYSVLSRYDLSLNDRISADFRDRVLRGDSYLCVHVRRGDYLNVASHVVSSKDLESVALKFTNFVSRVVILSDSTIHHKEFQELRAAFVGRVHVLDSDPDPSLAHSLMRAASILICSNSQFSLSAALLSGGLRVIPKKWFGTEQSELAGVIDGMSDFAVLKS